RVIIAGDVYGTGSSRKSATNSVMWATGEDIPHIPNKRSGAVVLGSIIAPIFLDTFRDAGGLPIVVDVARLETGDEIEIRPLPGASCEPKMTTVGSQDTTGPMTADELKELACLRFSADLVMQSFCHTAAYPKEVDAKMHRWLPEFIVERNGVSLRPGDGIIHS